MSFANDFDANPLVKHLCASKTASIVDFIQKSCFQGPTFRVRLDLLCTEYASFCNTNEGSAELSLSIFENALILQGFHSANDGYLYGLGLIDQELDYCDDYIECIFEA